MLRHYAHQSGRPPITLNLWVHALDGKAERGGDRAHAGLSEHLYQRRPSRLKAPFWTTIGSRCASMADHISQS